MLSTSTDVTDTWIREFLRMGVLGEEEMEESSSGSAVMMIQRRCQKRGELERR